MASGPTATDGDLAKGAVLARATPVLEFATSIRARPDEGASSEVLDSALLVVDDEAPASAAPRAEPPAYPIVARIVRRTRVDARETRAGTPWWLAGGVAGVLAIIGAALGLHAAARARGSASVASSIVGASASRVAAGAVADTMTRSFDADAIVPAVILAPPAPGRAPSRVPVAGARPRPTPHAPRSPAEKPKKPRPTAHA